MERTDSTARASVQVVLSWDGVPQCSEVYGSGKPFALKAVASDGSIALPEKLQALSEARVTMEEDTYFLAFPRLLGLAVAISRHPSGAKDAVPDVGRIALAQGDAVTLSIDDWSFSVRVTEAAPRARKHVVFAWRDHTWTLASVLVHGLFLLGMFFMPPNAGALNMDLDAAQARYIRISLDAIAREAAAVPTPTHTAEAQDTRGAPASTGEEGAAGARDEQRRNGGNVRVRGASDDTRAPLTQERVANIGVLGTIRALGLPTSVSSPYGAAEAMGFSEADAYGPIADRGGFGPGGGGLGIRGIGRGGCPIGQVCDVAGAIAQNGIDPTGGRGGCSREEFARLEQSIGHAAAIDRCHGDGRITGRFRGPEGEAADRRARVPELRVGDTETAGALSAEQIRRSIQRHLPEIRFCYAQALQSRPDLAGRVATRFAISPTGAVSSVGITQGLDPDVDTCVQHAVARWSFPAAPGITVVTYPFRFESAR